MAEAVGSAFPGDSKQKPEAKKNAADYRGVFNSNLTKNQAWVELLRNRLLEHAIDLFVGGVAASLSGLSSLQRLIRGALRAIGRGLRGLSGAGSRISSSLGSGGILHCLIGSLLDFVYRLLRDATARGDKDESGNTRFKTGGDHILHNFFPLHAGSDKWSGATKFTDSKSVNLMACSRGFLPYSL